MIIGILLDLFVWRRREMACLLLYHELLNFIVNGCLPYDYGTFAHWVSLTNIVWIYLTVACHLG